MSICLRRLFVCSLPDAKSYLIAGGMEKYQKQIVAPLSGYFAEKHFFLRYCVSASRPVGLLCFDSIKRGSGDAKPSSYVTDRVPLSQELQYLGCFSPSRRCPPFILPLLLSCGNAVSLSFKHDFAL